MNWELPALGAVSSVLLMLPLATNFKTLRERLLKYPYKRSALRYILRRPSLLLAVPANPSRFYFSKTLENVLDSDIICCLYNFLPEGFLNHLEQRGFGYPQKGQLLILYLVVKKYKPEIVVETGVARGASSAFMLCAMHEDSKGHPYLIDLPPCDTSAEITRNDLGRLMYVLEDGQRIRVNKGYEVGDLVPEYLRDRWTLIPGDAKKELPMLLE